MLVFKKAKNSKLYYRNKTHRNKIISEFNDVNVYKKRAGLATLTEMSTDLVKEKIYKVGKTKRSSFLHLDDVWSSENRQTEYRGSTFFVRHLDSAIPEFNQTRNMYLYANRYTGKDLSMFFNFIDYAYRKAGYDFAFYIFLKLYRDPVFFLDLVFSNECTLGMTSFFAKKRLFLDEHYYYSLFENWDLIFQRASFNLISDKEDFIKESPSFFNYINKAFLARMNIYMTQVINDEERYEINHYKQYPHVMIDHEDLELTDSLLYDSGFYSEIIDLDENNQQIDEVLSNKRNLKLFRRNSR